MSPSSPPSFLRRALAYLVDLCVVYLTVVCSLLACLMLYGKFGLDGNEEKVRELVHSDGTRLFIFWAHGLLYLTYFTLAHWYAGRTVGKAVFGIRLTGPAGTTDLSFGRSFGRTLGYLVSGQLTLGLGFLVCLFRQDGRTLHDLISSTKVIRALSAVPDAPAIPTAQPDESDDSQAA